MAPEKEQKIYDRSLRHLAFSYEKIYGTPKNIEEITDKKMEGVYLAYLTGKIQENLEKSQEVRAREKMLRDLL